MTSRTYSFLDISATIVGPGGAFALGSGAGNAEEGITITPAADVDTMQIGADGTGQHTLHADKSARITLRFLKTSPTNALLNAMLAFQRTSGATHGQNTIGLIDTNRGDTITAQQCAFAKVPTLSFGKDAGMIEWEFNCVQLDTVLAP